MASDYKSIASKIKFEGRAFINGKYVNAIDGKKFEQYLDNVVLITNFRQDVVLTLN